MTSTLPSLVQAVSGTVGSASAATLTYPLDLAATRLQLDSATNAQRRGGAVGGLRLLLSIVYGNKKKAKPGLGWGALYDGLNADISASALSDFSYFYLYSFFRAVAERGINSRTIRIPYLRDSVKQVHSSVKQTPRPLTVIEELLVGYVSGLISRVVFMPLSVITVRVQQARADVEDEDPQIVSETPSGTISAAKLIYRENGLKGFWSGFGTVVLLAIHPSINVTLFQLLRKVVVLSRHRKGSNGGRSLNLTPGEAFFVGAIASTITSTILYPFLLAKKRLQSRGSRGETLIDALTIAYEGGYEPKGHISLGRPDSKGGRRPSAFETNADIGTTKWIRGLYQGLQMQLVKVFLCQGVTFLIKGRIEQLVVALYLMRRRAAATA